MTTPTSNPVPSNDPRDLLFNAGALDAVVHSVNPTFTDRFGGQRLTAAGALNFAIDSIKTVNVRGAWSSGSLYAVKDIVSNGGAWYIAVVGHISGATFGGDSSKWVLYQGLTTADLQKYIGETKSLRNFGTLANDGTTDDASVWQLAAASGVKVIDARGVNCKINSQINIPAGQVWLLQGATLRIASSSQILFNADQVDDWALLGKFTIIGDGSTVGTAKAIRVSDCRRWLIDAPTIRNIRGWGLYMEPGTSTTARSDHGTVRSPRIDACYIGWQDYAGTGAEYCTVENVHVTGCTSAGIMTAAGNIVWLGGHCVDNPQDGVIVGNGSNHAHGSFIGMNINHNIRYNIVCSQVMNGQTFADCHIYGNGGATGAIFFDRSKGIHINGGHLDCQIYNYKDGSSGLNVIENMYCPGGYGISRQIGANDGHDQLVIRGLWGPGSYQIAGGKETAGVIVNDPSLCYVLAQRDTTTQSMTSGVSATLTWTQAPFPDRRGALNLGAGTFTVPANAAGLYSVDFDVFFSGTAMTATSSFVELKVNGSTKKQWFANAYSTTKLQVQGSHDFYMNAGDSIVLAATVVGTSPVFGDASWPSNFSVSRIA